MSATKLKDVLWLSPPSNGGVGVTYRGRAAMSTYCPPCQIAGDRLSNAMRKISNGNLECITVLTGNAMSMSTPKTLYRFEKAEPRRFATLRARFLFASKPEHFNDLFDCELNFDPFDNLLWPLSRIREAYELLYADPITSGSQWPLSEEIVSYLRRCLSTEGEELRTTIGRALISVKLRQEFSKSVGACCFFAAEPTDALMWAHYGDNHRGFCVEYEVASEAVDDGRLLQVEYSSQRPTLSFVELAFSPVQALRRVVRTKQLHWAHEKEYRIILQGHEVRSALNGIEIPMPTWLRPHRVIVGSRIAAAPGEPTIGNSLDQARDLAIGLGIELWQVDKHQTRLVITRLMESASPFLPG